MLAFKTDSQTKYVSFHSSYWDSRKTDGQPTFHLTLNQTQDKRTIELRQLDKRFFTPDIGIDARPTAGQTMFHFIHCVGIYDRRTKYVSFHSSYLEPSKRDRQKHLFQMDKFFFLPRYWNRCKDNRRTNYVSFHQLCWHLWQTDKIRFISFLILGFKEDRRTTYVSFNPQSKQDKRTIELRQTDKFFHPRYWNWRKTNRPTNYVSFHPLCWHLWQTYAQNTFHFTPHIGIQGRQADNLRFI